MNAHNNRPENVQTHKELEDEMSRYTVVSQKNPGLIIFVIGYWNLLIELLVTFIS